MNPFRGLFDALRNALSPVKSPDSSAQLTAAGFTQAFAEALRQSQSGLKVTTKRDLELRVEDGTGLASTRFLHNAFEAYQLNPSQKAAIFDKYLKAGDEGSSLVGRVADHDRVVPVIKPAGWWEETMRAVVASGIKDPSPIVVEPLCPGLIIAYAEDTDANISYLTEADLQRTHLSREEVRAVAVKNVRTQLLPNIDVLGNDGRYVIGAGGDYESSLMLVIPDLLKDARMQIKGNPVIAIPSRDLFFITGIEDLPGVSGLVGMLQKALAEEPRHLFPGLLLYRDGEFYVLPGLEG